MNQNFYADLGLNCSATKIEIKSAYRFLAKKYHPDTGGNKEKFLAIQLAWETLNDPIKKERYDIQLSLKKNYSNVENKDWSAEDIKYKQNNSIIKDINIKLWMKNVYEPLNRNISQIIKPLNNEIKKLSADPYDEELMNNFCDYISNSKQKIERSSNIYNSYSVPSHISSIGLDLYHCFSQVKDALYELDRYTQGYVDDYLFDGKEMMKEAKRIQVKMSLSKKNIPL